MASHNVKLNEICCCCCTWPDCAQEGCWGPRQSPWWGRGLAPWPPSCYRRGSHNLPGSPQGMAASARWTGARNRPCWSLSLHWASDVRVFAIWLGGSWTKPERTDLKSCKITLQFVMRMEMDLSMKSEELGSTNTDNFIRILIKLCGCLKHYNRSLYEILMMPAFYFQRWLDTTRSIPTQISQPAGQRGTAISPYSYKHIVIVGEPYFPRIFEYFDQLSFSYE